MKLDHMVIMLADLKANLSFYETLLPLIGFEKSRDHVFGNQDGVFLDFKQAEDPEHEYRRYSPGLNHMGFTAPDRDTLLSVKKAMADAGFEDPDIQTFDEGEAVFFKDPEGMRVELTFYYEKS